MQAKLFFNFLKGLMNKEDFEIEFALVEKSKEQCLRCDKLFYPDELIDVLIDSSKYKELESHFCKACLDSMITTPPLKEAVCLSCHVSQGNEKITVYYEEDKELTTFICDSCLSSLLSENHYEVCEKCDKYVPSGELQYKRTHHQTYESPEEGIMLCRDCCSF